MNNPRVGGAVHVRTLCCVGATCHRVHIALQGHASALFPLHHLIIIRHPSLSSISDASACRQPDLYLHD